MASQKDKLIAEALKLVEKGQYERGVKIYLKVVEEDASDIRIWLKIGDLYTKLRRNSEAADTYQHVAQAYSEQGFYTKAIAVYKQILKLDPSLVAVHERLADLYKQMGLLPDAIEQYTLVAQHHQREGRAREALGPLKQIVELEPQNIPGRVKLAELYSREQMVREAIDEFAKAAESLHEQERFDDYMKVAERLLFHSPDNRPVSRELARLYLARGEARRALPRLQVCFKADPRDGETLKLLAEAFQALGQTVKAVSVLKELARIYAENGSAGERSRTWRRVLELDPGDSEARDAAREETQSRARPDSSSSLQAVAQSVIVSDSVIAPSPFGAQPASHGPASSSRIAVPSLAGAAGPTSSATHTSPARPPQPLRTSRLDEVDTSSTVRSMPAFDLMLAAAAHGHRAEQPPVQLDEKEIAKILAETDVFTKYNLHAKAIEHVRSVFERNPDHVAAREKLAALLITTGRPAEALEELRVLAEQAEGGAGETRFLDEMLALSPGDPWAEERRSARRAGLPSRAASTAAQDLPSHVEVELDDAELTEEPEDVPRRADAGDPAALIASLPDEDFEEEVDLGVVDVDDAFDSTAEPMPAGDEFAVVVEDRRAEPDADLGPADIEDRFGADLDDDAAEEGEFVASVPALSHFRVQDDLAPELDPRAALSGDDVDEPTVLPPPSVPPPEAVDNFDFSSFDDPSPSSPSLRIEPLEAAPVADHSTPLRSRSVPVAEAPIASPPLAVIAALSPPPGSPADDADEDDEPTGDVIMPTAADQLDGSEAGIASLEDELEEADFYLAQGMIDETREALALLLASHPGHPLVLAKLEELQTAEAPEPPSVDATVAVRMEDLLGSAPPVAEEPRPDRGPRDSTAVTGVTRQIVEAAVNDDDFESHFDLGIGCKEMGLYDQAISEFKLAMRDPVREVQCQQMIGLCFLAKGQTHEAVRHFKQGLYAEGIREDEELSLYYELGQAYERLGDRAEALYYFERIRKRKARYRDIDRRIEALESASDGGAAPAALQRK